MKPAGFRAAWTSRWVGLRLPGAGVLAWMLFLFVLPFGEGSASPEGLLAAHLLFLAALAVSVRALDPDRSMLLAAGAVLAAAVLSGLLGPYRFASWLAIIDVAVLLGILVLGEPLVRRCARAGPWVLRAIVFAGLVQALLILVSRLAGSGRFAPGTLQNPSHAGAYLLIAFWALIAGRSRRGESFSSPSTGHGEFHGEVTDAGVGRPLGTDPQRGVPWGALGIGSLLLAACLVQASRGALLALGAGGAVYASSRLGGWSRRTRIRVVLGASLVLVAGGAVLTYRFATKEDPYRWDRLQLWGVALRVASQHPVVGCGPDVFPHITAPLDVAHLEGPVRYAKHVEATHSDPLKIVAETGLIGAVSVLVLLALAGRRALRRLREGGGREAALGAALGGLLVQCTVENLSSRPAVSCTGAMVAAILLAQGVGRQHALRGASHTPAVPGGEPRHPEDRRDVDGIAASNDPSSPGAKTTGDSPMSAAGTLAVTVLLHGGLLAIACLFVIAPYLGYRSFRLFQAGVPPIGERYRSAIWWNPIQPDYRAALAEAVLASKEPGPEDLEAGFRAVDEAISLKPIDARYFLLKARLGRRVLLSGSGDASWVVLADASYRRAESLDPHRPQAWLERGWMLLDLGRAEDAQHEAETALASEPNSFEARRLRAAALLELGALEEARAEMGEARRRREALTAYPSKDSYEAAVLRWDEEGWAQIERKLGVEGSDPKSDLPGSTSHAR